MRRSSGVGGEMDRDVSKENVPPMNSSRDTASPKRALKRMTEVPAEIRTVERERRQFVEAIETYTGEDPLDPWIRYIEWLNDNDRDGGDGSDISTVLESCTRKFKRDPRYRRDRRYLLVWVQYANFCSDPSSVFAFLEANDIGQDHEIFYRAYAMSMEVCKNFSKADEIYRVGIQRSLQPLGRLERMYKDFQIRMLQRGELNFEKVPQETQIRHHVDVNMLTDEKSAKPSKPKPHRLGNCGATSISGLGRDNTKEAQRNSPFAKGSFTDLTITAATRLSETVSPHCTSVSQREEAPSFEELRFSLWIENHLKRSRDAKPNIRAEVAETSKTEVGQTVVLPRFSSDVDTVGEHNLSNQAAGRMKDKSHAPHGPFISSNCTGRPGVFENGFSAELYSRSQVSNQQNVINDIMNSGNDISKFQTKVRASSNATEGLVTDSYLESRKPILISLSGEGTAANTSMQGDETVTITRFAEELNVLGSDPKMNGSDAVLHQGLVDPTITTKEALADILDMFSKPLHCQKPLSKAKKAKDRNKFPSSSATFEVFADEEIDLKSPGKPKQYEDREGFPSSSASCEMFTDAGRFLKPPAKSKKAKDTEKFPPSSASFEIFADEGTDWNSPAKPKNQEDGKGFPRRVFADNLAQRRGLHTIEEEISSVRKHNGSYANVKFVSTQLDASAGWDSTDKENAVVQNAGSRNWISDISDTNLKETSITPGVPSSSLEGLSLNNLDEMSLDLAEAQEQRRVFQLLEDDVSADKTVHLARDKSNFKYFTEESSQDRTTRVDGFPGSPLSASRQDGRSRPKVNHFLAECERDGMTVNIVNDSTLDATCATSENLTGQKLTDGVTEPVLQHLSPAGNALRDVSAHAEPKTVDPWDESYLQLLLKRVKPLMAQYEGYFESSEKYSGPIPNSSLRSSSGHNKVLQLGQYFSFEELNIVFPDNCSTEVHWIWGLIVLQGSCAYHLKRFIGKGAYAQVFEIDQDEDVGAGATKFACKCGCIVWQISPIYTAERLRETETEITVMDGLAASKDPHAPGNFISVANWMSEFPEKKPWFGRVRSFHLFSDCSLMVCEYGGSGTLQDVINAYLARRQRMDEVLCMYYTVQMIRMLEVLHGVGIIHGDIKPDNILIRRDSEELKSRTGDWRGLWRLKGLSLIDWGRSIDTMLLRGEILFRGDCKTDNFRCPEMLEGRPWRSQVDTFGVCGVVHCLLHGTYMQIRKIQKEDGQIIYQPSSSYRRYWNVELWRALFETLINTDNVGVDSRSLKVLRRAFEDHLASSSSPRKVKELLAKQSSMVMMR